MSIVAICTKARMWFEYYIFMNQARSFASAGGTNNLWYYDSFVSSHHILELCKYYYDEENILDFWVNKIGYHSTGICN